MSLCLSDKSVWCEGAKEKRHLNQPETTEFVSSCCSDIREVARSNLNKPHKRLFNDAEQQKIREYKARINQVEHADFTPLVFTTAGGMAPRMQLFLKRISLLMSEQQDLANSVVAGWLRCRFSFALLRTTLICLRGTRRKRYTPHVDDIFRAVHESRIDY